MQTPVRVRPNPEHFGFDADTDTDTRGWLLRFSPDTELFAVIWDGFDQVVYHEMDEVVEVPLSELIG